MPGMGRGARAVAVGLATSLALAGCGGGAKTVSKSTASTVTSTTTIPVTTTASPPSLAPTPTSSTTAAPRPTTTMTTGGSPTMSVTASSGALTITLAATPVHPVAPDQPIALHLTAEDAAAVGALGYVLSYGDGTTDQNVVPQFCVGSGVPAHQDWSFSHRYPGRGTYQATARVFVNCGGPSVSSPPVTVTIS